MKLFQQLLVAPAALGLLAPMAANAAELNLDGVSNYSASGEEVKSISQFSDVYPTDWAYQALTDMADRHGCKGAISNSAMTRYEAAALLNSCLENVVQVNAEERRLINEFGAELAVIKGRIDGIEADTFEAGLFSATTKLSGTTKFVVGAVEEVKNSDGDPLESVTFNYDTIISLDTSFTGEDLLRTTFRSGNFNKNDPFGAKGAAALETGFGDHSGGADVTAGVEVNRNFYQFPVGDSLTATVGAVVRQDDMLGVWPSSYPGDSVLDVLTYAGANDAYNLSLGAGAGVTYSNDNLSASLLFVSEEGEDASQGMLTEQGSDDVTGQVAWVGDNFTIAAAYTISDGGNTASTAETEDYDAWGISGQYDLDNGISLNAGIGWKTPDKTDDDGADNVQNTADDVEDTSTWSLGVVWDDAFTDGNQLGIAYGTAEGHRDDKNYDDPMAWEVYYSMAVSDNITITPAFFTIEREGDKDVTGGLVKTTFRF